MVSFDYTYDVKSNQDRSLNLTSKSKPENPVGLCGLLLKIYFSFFANIIQHVACMIEFNGYSLLSNELHLQSIFSFCYFA